MKDSWDVEPDQGLLDITALKEAKQERVELEKKHKTFDQPQSGWPEQAKNQSEVAENSNLFEENTDVDKEPKQVQVPDKEEEPTRTLTIIHLFQPIGLALLVFMIAFALYTTLISGFITPEQVEVAPAPITNTSLPMEL